MASIPEEQAAAGGTEARVERSPVLARPRPTPKPRIELCPYCGRESVNTTRCSTCGGHFDALSKQATQNAMGPWWLREGDRPLKPGCSYETIRLLVRRGTITAETVLRGPTTRQFWMRARRAPGVAHLLGVCHSCQREVSAEAFMCPSCGASFNTETDRQHLGLSPVSLLPGQAGADRIAAVSAAAAPLPMGKAGTGAGVSVGIEVSGSARAPVAAGPVVSGAMRASLLDDDDLGFGGTIEVPPRPRRGRSMSGALGLMALGAIVAAGGIWLALVSAQGDVNAALAAIGIGERPRTLAGGGGSPPDGAAPTAPGSGTSGAPAGVPEAPATTTVSTPAEQAPVIASGPAPGGAAPDVGATPAADPTSRLAEAMARVMAEVEAGRWRAVVPLVDAMERDGLMSGDDASTWRMAVEARVERAALAGLP